MIIKKIKIHNFKCFSNFEMTFDDKLNILVGNNDEGKSTILEAIHLCLTGNFRGKFLKNNLVQDVFNENCVSTYLEKIKTDKTTPLPKCFIELYFDEYDHLISGSNNSNFEDTGCMVYSIEFDSSYSEQYKFYIDNTDILSLPVEFYNCRWIYGSGTNVISKLNNFKSIIVDSSESNLRNSGDSYVSKVIKDNLDEDEMIEISQLYRKVRDDFVDNETMKKINKKISEQTHILDSIVQLDMDSLKTTDWEKNIITKINSIPFEFVGKGYQSAIKIELSLNSKAANKSSVLLIEEPENHLSYTKMNKLINEIVSANYEKQIFITTHSSFVANKLGMEKLILINNYISINFTSLSSDTYNFFKKKPGYDTLRFLLCKKAILVEGDADELIVQRAYYDKYNKLPIEDEIDIISVGTAFLRFLEIANIIKKSTKVLTDNDGNLEAVEKKYYNYISNNKKEYIDILYDNETHKNHGSLIAKNGGDFNYDTIEPCIVRANNVDILNNILDKSFLNSDELIEYMVNNKTECALKIFDSSEKIQYPKYIMDAINE